MNANDVRDKVLKIVSEKTNISVEKLQENKSSDFRRDLGMDSLAIMDMVMALEEAFQMTIPDEEMENVKDLGSAIEYLVKKLSKP